MTVRKNFVFDHEVAQHLEEMAKKEHKSQTALVQEMIEATYQEISKEEKLKAFESGIGSATGVFGELTIQDIKASMDV
ncbi:MAG: hypothetical protein U9N52_10525 [Campylobacterota bacterium]|nr:hypothetical protein [Campylobacterota bacterium]